MKKIFEVLIASCLFPCISNGVQAQVWSAETEYDPSLSTLYGSNTRFGYHDNNRSTYFMRYNDSTYFGYVLNLGMWITVPSSFKTPLPSDFIITDFKKFRTRQGYIGSYQDVGMYGWAVNYEAFPNYSTFSTFKLPAVDCLKRIALIKTTTEQGLSQTKAFAIGDRNSRMSKSCLLEFYAEGSGSLWSYRYVPLPFDSTTGDSEIATDVITIDNYVVFATRDYRSNHAPVNLRISDTNNSMLDMSLDFQFQFIPEDYETVYGEIRLNHLKKDIFVMTYVIYNERDNKYYLHFDRVFLADLSTGGNSIVSHNVDIEKDCSNLVDVVYEPDVQTMVVLLNGNNKSAIYHVNPFSNTSDYGYMINYNSGELWSIDTIGNYNPLNSDMYVAAGDRCFFSQDISNGIVVEESCYQVTKMNSLLFPAPFVNVIFDPVSICSDSKSFVQHQNLNTYFNGIRNCILNRN